jgi:tRNA A-37 threonylcarbamoyl transferase component Bud32
MVKFNFLSQFDIWIFKIHQQHQELTTALLNSNLLRKTDFYQTHSDFCILSELNKGESWLAKKIKYQIMADHIRPYLGQSQGLREFRSSLILKKLNIACPSPILAGTNISPWGTYESLFICRYLPGYINGKDFLNKQQNPADRKNFLCAVARDLAAIHGHGLFHKDTNFSNILCKPEDTGKIYWIDNDVKEIGSHFDTYEELALKRFQKALKNNFINHQEWDFFVDCYRNSLAKR